MIISESIQCWLVEPSFFGVHIFHVKLLAFGANQVCNLDYIMKLQNPTS